MMSSTPERAIAADIARRWPASRRIHTRRCSERRSGRAFPGQIRAAHSQAHYQMNHPPYRLSVQPVRPDLHRIPPAAAVSDPDEVSVRFDRRKTQPHGPVRGQQLMSPPMFAFAVRPARPCVSRPGSFPPQPFGRSPHATAACSSVHEAAYNIAPCANQQRDAAGYSRIGCIYNSNFSESCRALKSCTRAGGKHGKTPAASAENTKVPSPGKRSGEGERDAFRR